MKRALIAVLAVIGCLHPLYSQQEARQLFFEGENRFANEAYQAALERYGELIENYPDSRYIPDVQFRRGLANYHLGSYEDALILFDRVERRYRSTQFLDAVPFWKGLSYYHLGEFETAEEELSRFLSNTSEDRRRFQAYLYRGIVRSRLGRQEAAVEDFSAAAAAEEPKIAGYARALWSQLLYRDKQYDRITAVYSDEEWSPATLGEWYEEVLFYVGDAYFQQDEPAEADRIFSRLTPDEEDGELAATIYQRRFAIAQRRGDEVRPILQEAEERLASSRQVLQKFWLQVGLEHYKEGATDLAEFYFRRVWDLRERVKISGSAPLYLSRILLEEGARNSAREILEEARRLALEPDEEIALALAALYMDAERYGEATELLEELLAGDPPKEPEVRYRLAFAYFMSDRVNESLLLIDETFSLGIAGEQAPELLRLRSRAYRRREEYRAALQAIREYLALEPQDPVGRFEYATLLFRLGEYLRLLEELDRYGERFDPADAAYLRGLAQVGLGRFEPAVETLSALQGRGSLAPYRDYYLAFANYRLGRNEEALELFDRISRERSSPFAAKAAYLGGWSAFVLGSYERAAELLRRVASFDVPTETEMDAWRLLAETYRAAGEADEALSVYRTIIAEAERSGVIADAWLSYALLLEDVGRLDDALVELSALNSQFPGTDQGARALFEAGRLRLENGEYELARERFLRYRREYPRGDFSEEALYQEGRALLAQGQAAGAMLVWERFIEVHPESELAYEVKLSLAPLYEERGQLRRGYNIYSELLAAYPDRAAEDNLESRRQELSLRLQGLSDREASLWARIETPDSSEAERRDAVLELARIVIYEGGVAGPRRDLLVGYLRELANSDDPRAPRARFLLGEYFADEGAYRDAIDAYLAVAEQAAADLTARALFRAAQMYGNIGDREAVRTIVARIEEEFPESTWAAEGRRLLGGGE